MSFSHIPIHSFKNHLLNEYHKADAIPRGAKNGVVNKKDKGIIFMDPTFWGKLKPVREQ